VPDLPSPPHPRYPNLTGAQTANLATRYPTHRKQRGGKFFNEGNLDIPNMRRLEYFKSLIAHRDPMDDIPF